MATAILIRVFAGIVAAALLGAAVTTAFIAWHDWLALRMMGWEAMALTAVTLTVIGGFVLLVATHRPPSPVDRVRREVAADPWTGLAVAFAAGLIGSESRSLASLMRRLQGGR